PRHHHLHAFPTRRSSDLPGRKAVRFVWGDEPGGKAATLNAGVRAASGDIVMFTDTSQRFHPEAIGRLADALREQGVGAVSGNLEDRKSTRLNSSHVSISY